MLVFLALGDAKMLSFALGDAKVPDARYFEFWWNIGFTCKTPEDQGVIFEKNKNKKAHLLKSIRD